MTSLESAWYKSFSWSLLLLPLAWLFAVITFVRRWGYRKGWFKQTQFPVPVIVVGNINVGGTGKTPFVVWLVDYLQAQGLNPGVIARGYGATHSKQHLHSKLLDSTSCADEVGDEPLLVFQRCACHVAVGRSRIESAKLLLEQGCNVIVSDDGLQHYALGRTLEVVIVDAVRGFGNQQLLPAGPLREKPSRLASADIVVINQGTLDRSGDRSGDRSVDRSSDSSGARSGDNSVDTAIEAKLQTSLGYRQINKVIAHQANTTLGCYHIQSLPLQPVSSSTQNYPVEISEAHLVCGIGNPQRFQQAVQQLGITVNSCRTFTDHHGFCAEDFDEFDDQIIIMTEKDAVKCRDFAKSTWFYLPINAVVSPSVAQAIDKTVCVQRSTDQY